MLLTYIESLEEILLQLQQRYLTHERPDNRRDPDFFSLVKEETDPIFTLIDQWYQEAVPFVQDREVRVHPQQVDSTEENMKLLLLHSYYIDTPKSRYMELHQSVLYVMELLKQDLKQ
ncbi:DUF1798 family protein [Gracilibacillus timonensis]|nr:DUF1798 family protein [Gracilibacillus timonensis]